MTTTIQNPIYSIAVIGAGAAGMMAVNRAVLNNDQVVWFTGDARDVKRSRARWVKQVDNIPGLLGLERAVTDSNKTMTEWLLNHPLGKKNLLIKQGESIVSIVKLDNFFELTNQKGETLAAKYVVLCTGIMDVQPKFQDSIRPILPYANKQLALYCLRCDGHLNWGKDLAVIGHTNSAAWVAIMNKERYELERVYLLTNGETPIFSDEIKELFELYKIEVLTSMISEIKGDAKEKRLEGIVLSDGARVKCESLFVSLGIIPYNELAKNLGVHLDDRGLVLCGDAGQTNIAGLYVAGDLRSNAKKQIYTAWDQAVDALDHINQRLRAEARTLRLEAYRKGTA
jgi:thioredoxin reductase (NADPH)